MGGTFFYLLFLLLHSLGNSLGKKKQKSDLRNKAEVGDVRLEGWRVGLSSIVGIDILCGEARELGW